MNTHVLPESDVAAIKQTVESFTRCLEAKEFEDWVGYWANDGVLMPPGHPRVTGHPALMDYMRKNFGNVKSATLSDWKVIGEGGLAVTTTNVQWTADSKPHEAMKQVIVLGKDAAGKWLLKTVIFNAGT